MAKGDSMEAMAGRVLLTLVGAAGLITGAFMQWINGLRGMSLNIRALYQQAFVSSGHPPVTVGVLLLVIGAAAVVGIATSGWLTRLAGSLGILIFILLWIQLYMAGAKALPGPGTWLVAAGGIVSAIAGASRA
jgi:hypothetical protein